MNLKNSKIALFVFSLGAVALIGCNNTPVSSKVTITFDGNGGTVTPANGSTVDVSVDKGTLFKDVKAPKAEKTDYTFDAWTTTKDDITTKIKDDYVFNANITLFAHYTPGETFTYKFVDGDKTIKEDTIKKGETIPDPGDLDDKHAQDTDEKYYHYAFDGWYDEKTGEKFEIGTTISGNVVYASRFDKGNEVELVPGKQPTCSDSGYKDAYKCTDCFASASVVAYYDVPDSIADEHLIGDEDAYSDWIAEGGDGYLPATGEHDYQPEFTGSYKQTYTALEEFDKTGLGVRLHCSYEGDDHTHDVTITDFEVEYEADDDKLHVNEGAYVSFIYEGKDYKKDLELTVNPIEIDEPAAGTTSFTYTGSEITYSVAESDKYVISNNKQTNVGEYNATISLTDKGGDYVWKTSETTDDLTYPFSITKGTNEITGFGDSYTTTCHTAPTIENVTSKWGTVQYDYWQKVGEAEETQVTVDQLEAAENTTYRVRAYVPGTGNYDLVEDYATLTVNHGWGDPYSPTDYIGKKLHACVCGATEETDSLMESGDVNFITHEYGIKLKQGDVDFGTIGHSEEGTTLAFNKSDTDLNLYLPLTNYSAFETNVTFKLEATSAWFKIGLSSSNTFRLTEQNPRDIAYVTYRKNDNNLSLVVDRNGVKVFEDSTTITDSDILSGSKSFPLVINSIEAEGRVITFLNANLDECDHPFTFVPTDHIGYHQCALCHQDTDDLMTTDEVVLTANLYGIKVVGGDEKGTVSPHGAVGANFHFIANSKFSLPTVNLSAYEKVVFSNDDGETSKDGTQGGIKYTLGDGQSCEFTTDHLAVDFTFERIDNSSYKLTLVVHDTETKSCEVTVNDSDILTGKKGFEVSYNLIWNTDRVFNLKVATLTPYNPTI